MLVHTLMASLSDPFLFRKVEADTANLENAQVNSELEVHPVFIHANDLLL